MSLIFKSTTSYDPVFALLNAETAEERDKYTERWRDHKLEELNFIGIVGALLAGVLSSTGSWPTILPDGTVQPWTVRACWYCGTVLALSSVLAAAQQSIRLHRLSCHQKANAKIRQLLSDDRPCQRTGYILPRKAQIYSMQLGSIFLALSVLAMVVGLFILIWSGTGGYFPTSPWWDSEAKLAVTFTIVFCVVAMLFMYEQYALYSRKGEDEDDSIGHQQRERRNNQASN